MCPIFLKGNKEQHKLKYVQSLLLRPSQKSWGLVSSLSYKANFTCATNVINQRGIILLGLRTLTLSFKILAFGKYGVLDGCVLSCLKVWTRVGVALSTVWKLIFLGFMGWLDWNVVQRQRNNMQLRAFALFSAILYANGNIIFSKCNRKKLLHWHLSINANIDVF